MADILYMRRAFELAQLGRGKVSPNPMVGCVIVHNDRIIGEGWHQKYGSHHAEVNAIRSVQDLHLLPESTLYVTLEPCSHYGKTPPCADLLIEHNVKRVVISNLDSNPLVSGKGMAKLRAAGVTVESGLLEEEGRKINSRFFTFMEKNRPYIILKWAETADGFVARDDFSSKWISNTLARKLVHKWRTEEDSVMVGTNTALYDNPRLNVRDWSGDDPIRIVADRYLRLPMELHLFDQTQTTLCYNYLEDEAREYVQFIKLKDPDRMVEEIAEDLYQRKVQSVIVEGGSRLLNEFINKNLWDEARVFVGNQTFGKGIAAPQITGSPSHRYEIAGNLLYMYYRKQN